MAPCILLPSIYFDTILLPPNYKSVLLSNCFILTFPHLELCHLPSNCRDRVAVLPGLPPRHYRNTKLFSAPQEHYHVTVLPCRCRTQMIHRSYFYTLTHLTAVNYSFLYLDIVLRNFTKNLMQQIAITTILCYTYNS